MKAKNIRNQKSLSQGIFLFLSDHGDRQEKAKEFANKAGDFLEAQVSKTLEHSSLEAPVLESDPERFTWYRIPLREGLSGDGSEYHIYLRKGASKNLCIFFSGGGLAWNAYTAAHPITAGRIAAWEPNYYYNNLRPSTQLMNINSGLMENAVRNPFYDWNFIVITYATGDFHIGRNTYLYKDEVGNEKNLYFHGYQNFEAAMNQAVTYFPHPEKLLIAGDSAGGFAVPALAGEIASKWYKDTENITLLSDASLLCYDKWKYTVKDLWNAKEEAYDSIHTENLTLDWYTALLKKYPGRFQCLYSGSTHDYLLSTYYNDVTNKTYDTDQEVQDAFYDQLNHMVAGMRILDPTFGFFIHEFRTPFTHHGTVHTAVRRNWFYVRTHETTLAEWLDHAVNGKIESFGLNLL